MARGGQTQNRVVASSSGSIPVDDSSSLYYLHSGDHLGLTLGSHPLIGSNYNSWSRAVLTALTAKNKVSFIDGSLPRPTHDDLLFFPMLACLPPILPLLTPFRHILNLPPTLKQLWIQNGSVPCLLSCKHLKAMALGL